MPRFLHISDLHIHGSSGNSVNLEVHKRLLYLEQNFPDHILLISGDVTDDGGIEQYEQAHTMLWYFVDKGRCFVVPGNHDYGYMGLGYSEKAAKRFDYYFGCGGVQYSDKKQVITKIIDGVLIIGLNTNLQTINPLDFACGAVGDEQLNHLSRVLNNPENNKYKKILVLHHHLFYHTDIFMRLLDAERLINIIRGKIDVVCFGHRHEAAIWKGKLLGTRVIAAGAFGSDNPVIREIIINKRVIVKEIKSDLSRDI
ncbi:MAG: metallophosphoesterase [Prolixibacteraceae bacterium]|nr:metallophosphoesterase [Prolixibacteraceae bacterium]